ncbi:hypothetical protein HYX16_04295 [Candidatus Woesearchaeota archaeon]|nr:hypothetical protein [Candidatus Woesearchaeota archaeon]
MKFIVASDNGIWVKAQDQVEIPGLRKQMLEADVCISDLDDTDAKSPAKEIGIYNNLLSRRIFNPRYIFWGLKGLIKYIKLEKNAESECWKEYIKLFLRDPKELSKIKSGIEGKIRKLAIPGVKELYGLLPNAYKVYFSRNIIEVLSAFSAYFGFNEFHAEVFDKQIETQRFVERDLESKEKKPFTRYMVRGDSVEDESVLEVLDFYVKKEKIEYVVSCFRTTKEKENPRFTINVGSSDIGLVHLLN